MEYTVKHSKRVPITLINPSKGQSRVVSYKRVKVITSKVSRKVKITIGESIGLRYGLIKLDRIKRIVKSKLQANGQWSQWELL